ncbi:hypothetical protein PROFUN_12967 [Planoprotostelium fungivorum]|uniref:Transmembrane protein n=1 Tax=Planoprotostelium fungivorum TaxID=1890364 RepID=A0A2P6MZH3_9EUKA|nr:hypothetical protein PROFUN_12967 [Planoprotostelium fungivorum]
MPERTIPRYHWDELPETNSALSYSITSLKGRYEIRKRILQKALWLSGGGIQSYSPTEGEKKWYSQYYHARKNYPMHIFELSVVASFIILRLKRPDAGLLPLIIPTYMVSAGIYYASFPAIDYAMTRRLSKSDSPVSQQCKQWMKEVEGKEERSQSKHPEMGPNPVYEPHSIYTFGLINPQQYRFHLQSLLFAKSHLCAPLTQFYVVQ